MTPIPQISLSGHPWALDLTEWTCLGIELFCILLREQSLQRKPNFLVMLGLKPFTWMKQNWSPALDFFLVQAIRPPSESSAVPITATSGLLGHELHTTLSRLSEALEEDSLSKIRTLQKTSVLFVYKFGLPWKTLSSPKVRGFHSTLKGPSCFFLVQVSEAPALNEVTLPRWLL